MPHDRDAQEQASFSQGDSDRKQEREERLLNAPSASSAPELSERELDLMLALRDTLRALELCAPPWRFSETIAQARSVLAKQKESL